jgi:hypothetical protein
MDGKLAMAAIYDGFMDLWVLEDYDNDESWARRLLVRLPPALRQATLAIKPGVEDQNVILLGDCRNYTLGLYHLMKKRMLKRIQLFTTDDDDQPGNFVPHTPLHILVFRDSLKRHSFLDSLGS